MSQTQIGASMEVCLEVNAEGTKYILLSHYQNAEQNHDTKPVNKFWKCGIVQIFENDSNKSKFDSAGN
jgi:hypothetical protein